MRRLRWSMGRQLFVVCLHYAWKIRIKKVKAFCGENNTDIVDFCSNDRDYQTFKDIFQCVININVGKN